MFGYSKEAVRVKVKKCEGKLQPELRKFSVDPQITSLEVLQSILVKAFDIKSDFTLSYRSVDDYGQEIYLPLLSDWDLDAAFLKTHNVAITQRSEPCVQLKVDMKPFAEASEDWEPPNVDTAIPAIAQNIKEPAAIPLTSQTGKQETQIGFQGLMNQVEKTFNMVSRAFNLYDDPNTPPRAPLSDIEFRSFLDTVGQITNTSKLREVIYCGGIDPSLRKVVWKHILNVYPEGMNGKERMDYIKRKANDYYALRARWKECIQKGQVNADLAYVTSMVRKDVLRTDRHHNFYAGSDDNQNIASLFNILTTYAVNHPSVSYCQGMSDLASPLLVTMGDEAHAYICLCALMTRLYPNFLLDGEAMTLKFSHLTESLQVYDSDFYNYLKSQQADDLLFCYRWLLLEMKREFAFDDALRMLEVLWASLPHKTPITELPLKEKEFDPIIEIVDNPSPSSPLVKTPRENAYTKVCAIRRQSSSFSLANVKAPKLATCKQMNHSLDENATRKILGNAKLKCAKEFQSLDDAALQIRKHEYDKSDRALNKNKEKTLVMKDSKIIARRSMKSVPEHGKNAESEKTVDGWSSAGNLVNGDSSVPLKETPLRNQIRMLTDKISNHNNKFFSSLDKLNSSVDQEQPPNRPKVKMIKNLNEFLNLATSSKTGNVRLQRTHSAIEKDSPKESLRIYLNKASFDESDLTIQSKDQKPLNKINKNIYTDTNDGSSPDDSQEYYPMTTSMTRELRLEVEHLDRQVFGQTYVNRQSIICDSPSDSTSTEEKPTNKASEDKLDCVTVESVETRVDTSEVTEIVNKKSQFFDTMKLNARSVEDIYLWENPLHRNTATTRTTASCPQTPDEQAELDFDGDTGEIFEEHSGKKSITPIRLLRKNQSLERPDSKHSDVHSSESDTSGKDQEDPVKSVVQSVTGDSNSGAKSQNFFSSMSQELENAKRNCESLLNAKQTNLNSVASTINSFQKKYEVFKPPVQRNVSVTPTSGESTGKNGIAGLPPPTVFGGGNPFLMFLCLTVLLQHRDYIMRNRMDYNELAMHFDKMVRKHNVNRVLNQARQMYAMYLKQQANKTGEITT